MIELTSEKQQKLDLFRTIFEEYNSHTNLMSKNDLPKIWSKHIPDSLSINLFFEKYGTPNSLMDIGSGGGFPSVPIAIVYDQIQVTAIESISKKARFLNSAKEKLDLKNYMPVCARVENLNYEMKNFFDVVTSRAVADMAKIIEYSYPFLKKNGFIVAYKSKKIDTELQNSERIIKKYKMKLIDIISYSQENSEERCLVVLQK